MDALEALDTTKAKQVYVADDAVNATRFEIEEKCGSSLPSSRRHTICAHCHRHEYDHRPGAHGRSGERHCQGSAAHGALNRYPGPPDVKKMGRLAGKMLNQAMTAYAHDNVDLAKMVARQDDEVDALYAKIFHQLMEYMAQMETAEKIEAAYEALRAAHELERFADLATNIAKRVIYMVTGKIQEINVNRSDAAE